MKVLLLSIRAAGLTAAVRGIGAVKEIIVAGLFGTGDSLDAFIGGSSLLVLSVNVLISSLGLALIPRIAHLQQSFGEQAARDLTSRILAYLTTGLTGLAALLWMVAPYAISLLCPGFHVQKLESATDVLRILLPTLPLTGLCAVWGGVLSLKKKYGIVAITPALTPLSIIGFISLHESGHGITSLVLGTLFGTLLETVVLGGALIASRHMILPWWNSRSAPEILMVFKQYSSTIVAALLSGSTLLIDQIMVSPLGPGSISSLSYGSKVIGMTLAVVSTGLALVLLPSFSELVARREWIHLRSQYTAICRQLALASVPAVALFIFFSPVIVHLVFERGAFNASDTIAVSRIQSMYALQIPFHLIGIITARMLSALSANHVMMWIGFVNVIVNIGGNILLSPILGVAGIALSSSLVQLVACVLLIVFAVRVLRRKEAAVPGPSDARIR